MKRSLAALAGAALLALTVVAPTAAVSPNKPGGGSMTADACINGINGTMALTVDWTNETVNLTKPLSIQTKFSGGSGIPFSSKFTVSAPVPSTGSALIGFVLAQGSAWSDWTTIANSANGAFKDAASTLTMPPGGWLTCPGA
jgi:hypothetical protein